MDPNILTSLLSMLSGSGGNAAAGGNAINMNQATQALARGITQPSAADFWSDPNAMSQLFGMMGQAFSARDPNSWQYQLSGVGKSLGQSGSFREMLNEMAIRQLANPPKPPKPQTGDKTVINSPDPRQQSPYKLPSLVSTLGGF